MRLWRRRREPPTEPPTDSTADEALEISSRRRDASAERRSEFERIARRMRRIREVNHLAEAFERAFGEGHR